MSEKMISESQIRNLITGYELRISVLRELLGESGSNYQTPVQNLVQEQVGPSVNVSDNGAELSREEQHRRKIESKTNVKFSHSPSPVQPSGSVIQELTSGDENLKSLINKE